MDNASSLLEADNGPLHPFWPLGVPMPGYVANSMSTVMLLSIFAAGCIVIFIGTRAVIKQVQPSLPQSTLMSAFWFTLCGFIHSFFEGYFAYNFLDMASQNDLFGQLWKEYALSDSRYMTQDSFVVCMETITAVFWGPMSFMCAYCIIFDHPMRHPLQLIISLGQFYGVVLYYATCSFQEAIWSVVICRPERIYFWAYYFLCNAFWVAIPIALMYDSVKEISSAMAKVKRAERSSKQK